MVVIAVALSFVLPALASAQTDESGEHPGFLAASGRASYSRYCASCHGKDAKGGGTVAKFLKVPPADLTALAAKYDGEFPKELIAKYIDGTQYVRTHGARDMPIWGEVFESPLVEGAEDGESGAERADRKIRELVYFLETLQPATEEAEGDGEDGS